MRTAVFAMIIGLLLIADAGAAQRNTKPISIVVRVYDGTGLAPVERDRAIDTATAILETALVRVVWRHCDAPPPAHDPCDRPLAAGEGALRFVAEPRLGERPADRHVPASASRGPTNDALGYSLIDTRLRRGSLATVYPQRVGWLAATAGVDRPLLLGRAVAHEIGHLLLGTNEHRATGVMRAVWSLAMLRHDTAPDWMFTAADAADIAAAVERRHEVATSIVWSTQ
jgi:hypothetical protein